MQIHSDRPRGLVRPNTYALRRIVYSIDKMVKTNNYRLLKLAQGTRLAYPHRRGYS